MLITVPESGLCVLDAKRWGITRQIVTRSFVGTVKSMPNTSRRIILSQAVMPIELKQNRVKWKIHKIFLFVTMSVPLLAKLAMKRVSRMSRNTLKPLAGLLSEFHLVGIGLLSSPWHHRTVFQMMKENDPDAF